MYAKLPPNALALVPDLDDVAAEYFPTVRSYKLAAADYFPAGHPSTQVPAGDSRTKLAPKQLDGSLAVQAYSSENACKYESPAC